ncbi:MAG: phospho-sugar mutase [Eubacteriales bacterium]
MIFERYNNWMQNCSDRELSAELKAIADDEVQIHERFSSELQFGTAGLRGILGAGTNRMNIYTVGRATQALASRLRDEKDCPVAAIAYDSRNKSELFARTAACVLAAGGVTVHLFPAIAPTPALSFAVRRLDCDAGIVVTASHNPAKYNGYKVYGADGGQMTEHAAGDVQSRIGGIDCFTGVKSMDFGQALSEGKVRYISQDIIDEYVAAASGSPVLPDKALMEGLNVVYTPLNGAGYEYVMSAMKRIGVGKVSVVEEQRLPDGDFPTCPYPNPEKPEALRLALELCERERPDVMIATDPDCDRVGVAAPDGGEYRLLSGNEVGVLLMDYICRRRTELAIMPKSPVAVSTIVSTTMTRRVAEDYGVQLLDVLTGFKYIGEQITLLAQRGEEDRYILGFEESCGYLSGTHARDKDGVDASCLICGMAAYYKAKGQSLHEVMRSLYGNYGCYRTQLAEFAFEGSEAMATMKRIMEKLRLSPPSELDGLRVTDTVDYLKEGAGIGVVLPPSDVFELRLEGGAKVIARPSGTEPKLKVYIFASGRDEECAAGATQSLTAAAKNMIDSIKDSIK